MTLWCPIWNGQAEEVEDGICSICRNYVDAEHLHATAATSELESSSRWSSF